MKKAGQIVLFRFPQTNLDIGKLRPALLLGKVPGNYDDYLVCMISSNLEQAIENIDEIITYRDNDFVQSGLKMDSVFRVSRLAVIESNLLLGSVGEDDHKRFERIKSKIINWINEI